MSVTWTEPTATDNSGMTPTVTQSHQPGVSFPVGITQVTYTFTDMAENEAMCSFSVTLGNLHYILSGDGYLLLIESFPQLYITLFVRCLTIVIGYIMHLAENPY